MARNMHIRELPVIQPLEDITDMAVYVAGGDRGMFTRKIPMDDYTVSTREEAIAAIDEILAKGKRPLILAR